MNRIITLVLAMAGLLLLVSCSTDDPRAENNPTLKPVADQVSVPEATGDDQSKADSSKPAEKVPSQAPAPKAEPSPTEKTIKPSVVFQAADLEGVLHNSGEWLGKGPVVINFWGTWCPPCRRELPHLMRLYAEYHPKGVEIVGLALRDTPDKVRNFLKQQNLDWVMLMGNPQIAMLFGLRSVPMTVFFDRNGKKVMEFRGLRSYEALKTGFEAIL